MEHEFPMYSEWESEVHPTFLKKMESLIEIEEDQYNPEYLNAIFTPLSFRERIHILYAYFSPHQVLVTSSFGINSAFLLNLLNQLCPQQKIHFIDTTYHFPETHEYKALLSNLFDLSIIDVFPEEKANQQTSRQMLWKQDSEACCTINKVQPLQPLKDIHQVWMSGVMGFQTSFRASLSVFEQQEGMLKFHPLIDVDEQTFQEEFQQFNLPLHPLKEQGFGSVGCTHCTRKGAGRSGRWADRNKTECGLHPGFFQQKKDKAE